MGAPIETAHKTSLSVEDLCVFQFRSTNFMNIGEYDLLTRCAITLYSIYLFIVFFFFFFFFVMFYCDILVQNERAWLVYSFFFFFFSGKAETT